MGLFYTTKVKILLLSLVVVGCLSEASVVSAQVVPQGVYGPNFLAGVSYNVLSSTTLEIFFPETECKGTLLSGYLSSRIERWFFSGNEWVDVGGGYTSCVDGYYSANGSSKATSTIVTAYNNGEYVLTLGSYSGFSDISKTAYYIRYKKLDNDIKVVGVLSLAVASSSYQTRIVDVDVSTVYENSPTSTLVNVQGDVSRSISGTSISRDLSASTTLLGKTITKLSFDAYSDSTDVVFTFSFNNNGDVTNFYYSVPTTNTWYVAEFPTSILVTDVSSISVSASGVGYGGYAVRTQGTTLGGDKPDIIIEGFEQSVDGVAISAQYFIETDEIVSTISSKNPTMVMFEIASSTNTLKQGQSINNTLQGFGTSTTEFNSLGDGSYDLLVKFSNFGCQAGTAECPFPLSYVYSSFVIASGEVISVGDVEVYDNLTPLALLDEYEDCGVSNIGGCINNSFRFLFVPSNDAISKLLETKNLFETKIPFVYVFDMVNVVDEIFNTSQSESVNVSLDLGFGTVDLINGTMISNAPQANVVRTLLSYILWVTFAFSVYRLALGIHNRETT